jgi:phage gpG-like protein
LSGNPLAQRSGKLKGSVRYEVSDRGDTVVGRVMAGGGIAPYGMVHEYGGVFQIPRHLSMSRLGNAYSVRAHQARFPQRAFMAPSMTENEAVFYEMAQQGAYEALGE